MKRFVYAVLCLILVFTFFLPPFAHGQDPYLGEIRMFAGTFAPRGWAFCDGQLLAISQNVALFSLIGTTYGGDGRTTFGLPDLRGRGPIHAGQGPGLTRRVLGETGGEESNNLTVSELPSHTHTMSADSSVGSDDRPAGNYMARDGAGIPSYGTAATATMNVGTIVPTGGGRAHNNMAPYLTVHYIIALQGIYPSRP